MIKLSIIVPVYNVENYLEKCLTSLVNQTMDDIEIIIVNDGTKDNSQKIIDKFAKKYDFVKAYKKENGGLSSARNYGLDKANGDYIGFVDSDDYVDSNMFKKLYDCAIKNDYDIVLCDTINVYENGVQSYRKSNLKYSNDTVKNYLIAPPAAWLRIYKKCIFDDTIFTENIFYEDLFLTPSLVLKTKKIGFVDEGLYYYLQRSGSIMNQCSFNFKLLDIFNVLQHNYDVLYGNYPDEIEYLYITHLLRTATMRFLDYKNVKQYLKQVNNEMKVKFPNWKNNKYFKLSSFKMKLICNLAYMRCYLLINLIKKIGG